jgi:hypothetical protein
MFTSIDATSFRPGVVSMSPDATLRHHVEDTVSDAHLASRFVAGAMTRCDTSAPCAGNDVPPLLVAGLGTDVAPVLADIVAWLSPGVVPELIDIWRPFSPT